MQQTQNLTTGHYSIDHLQQALFGLGLLLMVPLGLLSAQWVHSNDQLLVVTGVLMIAGGSCFFRQGWRVGLCLSAWALSSMLLFYQVRTAHGQLLLAPVRHVPIQGMVVGVPSVADDHVSFNFHTEQIAQRAVTRLVALQWYAKRGLPLLRSGQRWQMMVSLRPLHSLHNPGGHDGMRHWLAEGVSARGAVVVRPSYPQRLGEVWTWQTQIDRWRGQIWRRLLAMHLAHAGLIAALVLGVREGISSAQWQLFQRSGASHLIAISGLHIGLVAGAFYGLGKWAWRLWPRGCSRLPAPIMGRVVGLVGGCVYSVLAGGAISTQRAVCLLVAACWLSVRRRSYSIAHILALSAAGLGLLAPTVTLGVGYWLSFLAVACLVYANFGRLVALGQHKLGVATRSQWSVQLGTMPVIVGCFSQLSVCSLWVNAWAIPVFSVVLVPMCLLGVVVSHGQGLLWLADHCWAWVLVAMRVCASLPGSYWYLPSPPLWALVCAGVGVVTVLAPWRGACRWLGLGCLMPLFALPIAKPGVGEAWITVLDVGQGLATVVQTAHHSLVFDTGAKYRDFVDRGAQVVVPFLQFAGIGHLDRLLISHGDNDHAGGAQAVLDALPVGELMGNVTGLSRQAVPCLAGQAWRWDKVDFRMRWPGEGGDFKGNNHSCVLQIEAGGHRALLTGDIEKPVERGLVQQYGAGLQSDVLVVPHHGSGTSSTEAFLAAVRPRWAVFSVGFYNRFHFPRSQVLMRYMLRGVHIARTDWQGALRFELAKRIKLQQFWLHRALWD